VQEFGRECRVIVGPCDLLQGGGVCFQLILAKCGFGREIKYIGDWFIILKFLVLKPLGAG
jgi:hypothetical protein